MDRKGQTTVEFALTALLLFAFLFAIIDLAVMFYVNLTMQHAVREGARFAITGQPDTRPTAGQSRKDALRQIIESSSNGLYKNDLNQEDPTVSVLTPTSTSGFSNYTGTPTPFTGKPDQIIIVSLTYNWPLLTPMLSPFFPVSQDRNGNNVAVYRFTVRATMKNELWGP